MSDLVKQFDRKGAITTYNLLDALSRNTTTIFAGADICAEAKSTILVQADRIEELEAKLAKAMTALVEVREFVKDLEPYAEQGHTLVPALQKACLTLAELTGGKDE